MEGAGATVRELLLELAQTERKSVPPYQTEKVQRVQQQIRYHHQEMTQLIHSAEEKTRERQGLSAGASIEMLPWSEFPADYTAMIAHMTCIERYKRGLLAYVMERVERIKHIYWNKHLLPADIKANLAPLELQFLEQYGQGLKRYSKSCELGVDLTTDVAPPKSRCLQVRVLGDHGDMMSKEGKVVLKKDSVHLLPVDEVEHLVRAGVVEYLHTRNTM